MKPNYISDTDWQLVNSVCNYNEEEPYLVGSIGWHETNWNTNPKSPKDYHLGFGYYKGSKILVKVKGLANQLKYAHEFIALHFNFPVTLKSTTEFAVNHWKSSVPTAWAKSVYAKFLKLTTMSYYEHLTRNLIYGETWSTKVIAGIRFKRRVPPIGQDLIEVRITAVDYQKVRDKLNEVYGANLKIGPRDKNKEIMLYVNSFWRELIFQAYLFLKGESTTTTGDHPLGKAVDLRCPKGMTSIQFFIFINDEYNTLFNWFKIYDWGVHCARR